MITGPKYKKARRLGAAVFDKTQTQKFAAKMSDRKATGAKPKRASSDFGIQLLEKQKAKTTYGMGEKQFKNAVEMILAKKGVNISEALMAELETRLDNTIYRLGFGKTRQATRQIVNHGHINVNGKRLTIPSYKVKVGDIIAIRELSQKKPIFKDITETLKEVKTPSWLALNIDKREGKVQGVPKIPANELAFDISQIFQYYSK